jgi:ParB-like chromosome segregation protein Spo0J
MSSLYPQKSRKITLLSLAGLWPHEEHDNAYADSLVQSINVAGQWTTPIIVDRGTNVILDGHHRFAAPDKLGLGLIPAILLDYPDSEISVSSWRSGI